MTKSLHDHFDPKSGAKRILSLDGGGIRGALTLGYLKKIETILRDKENNPNYLLSDYFDLIGGTSTGSIIAGGLAIGMTVDNLKEMYFKLGKKIFRKKNAFNFIFKGASFTSETLKKELEFVFQDRLLSDDSIRTGLAIFAKRMDTQSLWTIHNNFNHSYWKYQKDYLLRESIRASTAAPTYFDAQTIDVKNDGSQNGDFVDGGLSTANNPALNLFLLATVPYHAFNWAVGKENLSIYSIGTGRFVSTNLPNSFIKPIGWAKKATQVLMEDVSEQNEIMLQLLSHSNMPRYFDRVIKDLADVKITKEPLLNHYRYNVLFESESLNELGFSFSEKDVRNISAMDNPKYVKELFEIGYRSSAIIDPSHLN